MASCGSTPITVLNGSSQSDDILESRKSIESYLDSLFRAMRTHQKIYNEKRLHTIRFPI